MNILTWSLIIGAIGVIVFLSGIKSETKFKGIFILAGLVLSGFGGYGMLTGFLS